MNNFGDILNQLGYQKGNLGNFTLITDNIKYTIEIRYSNILFFFEKNKKQYVCEVSREELHRIIKQDFPTKSKFEEGIELLAYAAIHKPPPVNYPAHTKEFITRIFQMLANDYTNNYYGFYLVNDTDPKRMAYYPSGDSGAEITLSYSERKIFETEEEANKKIYDLIYTAGSGFRLGGFNLEFHRNWKIHSFDTLEKTECLK